MRRGRACSHSSAPWCAPSKVLGFKGFRLHKGGSRRGGALRSCACSHSSAPWWAALPFAGTSAPPRCRPMSPCTSLLVRAVRTCCSHAVARQPGGAGPMQSVHLPMHLYHAWLPTRCRLDYVFAHAAVGSRNSLDFGRPLDIHARCQRCLLAVWPTLVASAMSWLSTYPTSEFQAACEALASNGLGAIVEACGSAVPYLVGSLRDWGFSGALALECTGF